MDLDIPPFLIVVWQVFAGISLAFFILSFVFILGNKRLPNREKMLWLLGTLLLPILGPILFLTLGRQGK
ncbi:MAG TPA: PLDc N-terminal domain-containing protein [Cyclobacteriaceae bacterium]|nr:PLDc N-terminal domain-containing protein [Cyclobacteriaceae bacterium]